MSLLLRELGSSNQWLLEGSLWLRFVPSDYVELLMNTAFAIAVRIVHRPLHRASFRGMCRLVRLWLSVVCISLLRLTTWLVIIVHLDCTFLVLELLEGHRWDERSCRIWAPVCWYIISLCHICHFSRITCVALNYHIISILLSAIHRLSLVQFNIDNLELFPWFLASISDVLRSTVWWDKILVATHVDCITSTVHLRSHTTWSSTSFPHVDMPWQRLLVDYVLGDVRRTFNTRLLWHNLGRIRLLRLLDRSFNYCRRIILTSMSQTDLRNIHVGRAPGMLSIHLADLLDRLLNCRISDFSRWFDRADPSHWVLLLPARFGLW